MRRKKTGRGRTERDRRVRQLRRQGLSFASIARRLHLSRAYVAILLHRTGPDPLLRPRPCAVCGTRFQPVHPGDEFCSRRCRKLSRVPKRPRKQECWVCGQSFLPLAGHERYCSEICRRERERRRQRAKYMRRVSRRSGRRRCELCGTPFRPRRPSQRFCSSVCRKGRRLPRLTRRCQWCGKPFTTFDLDARYCSPDCSRLGHHPPVTRHCAYCGAPFTSSPRGRRFCSPKCRREATRPDFVELTTPERRLLMELGEGSWTAGLRKLMKLYHAGNRNQRSERFSGT